MCDKAINAQHIVSIRRHHSVRSFPFASELAAAKALHRDVDDEITGVSMADPLELLLRAMVGLGVRIASRAADFEKIEVVEPYDVTTIMCAVSLR
jgi:hypothetical protein